MDGIPRRPHAARRRTGAAGFTLIELGIVIVVIGIIMAIGLANFVRFRTRAQYAGCVTNQRHAYEAALMYVSNVNPGTVTFDVNVLTGGGYLPTDAAECPLSAVDDFNDYTLDVVSNAVTNIACKQEPLGHHWAVP
jgi:prepilin-type N-terminal cleavage/methylation domain-containing protein